MTLFLSSSTSYCFARKARSGFLSQPDCMQQPSPWLFCSLPAPTVLPFPISSCLTFAQALLRHQKKFFKTCSFLLLSRHHHLQQPPLTALELYALSMPRLRKAAAFSRSSKAARHGMAWHGMAWNGIAWHEHGQPAGKTSSSIRLTASSEHPGEGLSRLQGCLAQGIP